MKYSYSWLKEISGTKKTAKQLAEMVMLKGFEFEGMEKISERFKNFVVGEIVSVKKHPNADKLQLAKVRVGKNKINDIVCGAKNIKAGDKVPAALPGAILPNSKIEIKKTEIRGEKSEGMLCAEDELGLGKNHDGIMILGGELEVGADLAKALKLDETMIEFDILPNRAHDCLSHRGMAGEIAAMENKKIKNLSSKLIRPERKEPKILTIDIKDKELCPRYMGAVLEKVTVKPSPRWMQNRLIACGMEPINNIVDITNYVMLEVGNPLHAFDLEKIKITDKNSKAEIIVRRANKRESLILLDDSKLELDESDLLITNGEKPLALAGIKGGKDSGINTDTKQIVLESANFNGFSIRKSRQRHGLSTEAQARFEKEISPVLAEKAIQRAIELFQKHAGAELKEIVDENFHKQEKRTVSLNPEIIESLLGQEMNKNEAKKILSNLGFKLAGQKKNEWKFEIPYWRLDIEGQEDLVEEIGRISGYEKIKEAPIEIGLDLPRANKKRQFEWKAKDILVALGFDEALSYSFYGKEEAEKFGFQEEHFEIKNALSLEKTLVRKSLLPGLLEKASLNAKNFEQFLVFEIGKTYSPGKNNRPLEEVKAAGAVYGKNISREELFYRLKGKLEEFSRKLVGGSFDIVSENKHQKFLAENRSGKVVVGGRENGFLGEIEKNILKFYYIKNEAVAFELSLDGLFEIFEELETKKYQPIRKFPVVERDVAMFVGRKTEVGSVEKTIQKEGGKKLLSCDLFDVYEDKESGKKSLAFHLDFGENERTMTGEEADKLMEKIIEVLESDGCEVRKG